MKVRQGFVSNSSSSSFVILGALLGEEISWEKRDEYQGEGYAVHVGSEGGVDEGETAVGYTIASGDDCDFYSSLSTLDELNKKADKLKEKFPDKEIKFISGVEMC